MGIVGEVKKKRPNPGDLVAVNSANDFINVYIADANFSFAKISFMALNGEMGIVIDHASDESGSILFHYVKVLFQRGAVGIAHSGLLSVLEVADDVVEDPCNSSV